MESGMDEQDATFKALDDMMLYDNDFHDMVQGAFLKVSQDYQVQIEEMHDRFSVYFAVLEKLPQEAQQTLEEQTKAMKEETGDDIGLASFDTIMSTYLNTPDGAAVLENIASKTEVFGENVSIAN